MESNELTKMEQIMEEVKVIKSKLNSGESITQEESRLLTINDWSFINNKNGNIKQLKYYIFTMTNTLN